jgi:hypothetical protein
MDKQFWMAVDRDDYRIPEGHTLENLTAVLFGYLSSTDLELRDEIAYTAYANWLKREMYTQEQVSRHVEELLSKLEEGIGETESDSVFLRAFSVLFLAEIVHNDNKKSLLEKDQVESILAKGLWYLNAEKDPRGHVPVKGWAHALAHTADLMLVLAKNRFTEADDLEKILNVISEKIVHSTAWVFIHGEDDRLADAVIEILRRGLLPLENVEAWANSFLAPDGNTWKGVYVEKERNRAFQNTRNLLQSIYLALISNAGDIPNHERLKEILFNALSNLRPY